MQFEDRQLVCAECGGCFVFSAGEQEFFKVRNLTNVPKRCPNCRLTLRYVRAGMDVAQFSEVPCGQCQAATRVPFKPKGHKPVYCNDCLAQRRSMAVSMVDERMAALTPA